jgi:glycosyltransferase involved in cell wall biosynthesis
MKRSQAIHRRLTEEHEQISAKAGAFAGGLLVRSEVEDVGQELARVLSVPGLEESPSGVKGPPPANDGAQPLKAPPARKFPYHEFASDLDPAVVKARYLVGPTDPTILFVGDLDERHAPDLVIRAMPQVLKKHPQARLIIVGDGTLMWPLRVMSRYMLLDYAVRIPGHVGGRDVRELIAAVDIMVVPSRSETEDWQILSGWSARRAVVATRAVSNGLCAHEEDSVIVDAEPTALVAALDRILADHDFAHKIGDRGYRKVIEQFSGEPSGLLT